MKTRIILDIETGRFDKDILNNLGLRVVKKLKKAKASLLSIRTEKIEEEKFYIDFLNEEELDNKEAYKDFQVINNGFIDDCIKIIRKGRLC